VSPDRQGRAGAGRSQPRHRTRVGGRATVAAVFLLLILASPAAADPCALSDPTCVTETVDETVDTVKEVLGAAKEKVDETTGDTTGAVGDTASGVVGAVEKTVDGLLGNDGGPNPGGGPKPGGGDGADRPRGRDNAGRGRRAESLGTRRLEPREPSIDVVFRRDSTGLDWPTLNPPDAGALRRAVGAAAKMAFPILLASMVLAFLLIQNHLDRKDPRLASAPLGPDLLTFE
jgi:hypothetical protein